MYSPKIPERLIHPLYQLSQTRRQPMTRVVAEILDAYLESQAISVGDSLNSTSRPDSAKQVDLQSPV
jgi:hypothetical protein